MNEAEYRRMAKVAERVMEVSGAYLWDEAIDRENVLVDGVVDGSADYWERMVKAGRSAFDMRCEENGLDCTNYDV